MNNTQQKNIPVLFVSHGSPTFALETTHTSSSARYLTEFAQKYPKPTAIVVVSPHWQTQDIAVTSGGNLKTIHDFGGFAPEMYTLQYPAKGDAQLAAHIVKTLQAQQWPARINTAHGLDHGAWVPLMKMYPDADIPIVQVSLPYGQTTAVYYAMGQQLAHLHAQNVLILCSGSMTHNLYEVRLGDMQDAVAPYVVPFRNWIKTQLGENHLDHLLNYRTLAPHAEKNHPTDEHLMPLYVAMGAAGFNAAGGEADYFCGELPFYTLAMDNVVFQ